MCVEVGHFYYCSCASSSPARKITGKLNLPPLSYSMNLSTTESSETTTYLIFSKTIAPFGSRSLAASTRKGCWLEKAAGLLPRRRGQSGRRPSHVSPGVEEEHPQRALDPRRLDQPPPGVRQRAPGNHPPTGRVKPGYGAGEGQGRGLQPGALVAVRARREIVTKPLFFMENNY